MSIKQLCLLLILISVHASIDTHKLRRNLRKLGNENHFIVKMEKGNNSVTVSNNIHENVNTEEISDGKDISTPVDMSKGESAIEGVEAPFESYSRKLAFGGTIATAMRYDLIIGCTFGALVFVYLTFKGIQYYKNR